MLKVGDLVIWSGARWLVKSIERQTKSAVLSPPDNHPTQRPEVVAMNLDVTSPKACVVVGNPLTDWPFVVAKPKRTLGRLVSVLRPTRDREVLLQPLIDWVIQDTRQIGGSIFLNPALRLRIGEVLVAVYEKGRMNIDIHRNFGTTRERVARATPPPDLGPRTSYDRLLESDFDDEDE